MLIASHRHTPGDIEAWSRVERAADAHSRLGAFRRNVDRATSALRSFVSAGDGYAGVSWGKDSTVIAHLIATLCPSWPLIWVRVEPIANPDCDLVRDAFLREHPSVRYDEIAVWCHRDGGEWHASGTLERGFAQAAERYGSRYITGIRAEESGIRKMRVATHGLASRNTCAPIGWWSALDVWAYLHTRGTPIHPAYACSMNGLLDHGRLRVSSLGGERGTGMGRRDWEQRYYPDELARIRAKNG